MPIPETVPISYVAFLILVGVAAIIMWATTRVTRLKWVIVGICLVWVGYMVGSIWGI